MNYDNLSDEQLEAVHEAIEPAIIDAYESAVEACECGDDAFSEAAFERVRVSELALDNAHAAAVRKLFIKAVACLTTAE